MSTPMNLDRRSKTSWASATTKSTPSWASSPSPDDLVEAGRKIRDMGYTKLDAMTPFPVHGIDDAIGVPPSKLGWIVIWCSACGHGHRAVADLVRGRDQLSAGHRRQAAVRFHLFDSGHLRVDGFVLRVRQLPRHVGAERTAAAVPSLVQLLAMRIAPPTTGSCW